MSANVVERVNGFAQGRGARHLRVRGHKKVYAHLRIKRLLRQGRSPAQRGPYDKGWKFTLACRRTENQSMARESTR